MKIFEIKPSLQQIKNLLKDSYEVFYLEGMNSISKKSLLRYQSREICKNYRESEFIVAKSYDNSFLGMAIFHNSEWDMKYLKQNIAKVDLIITKNTMLNRKNIYRLLLERVFFICRSKKYKLVFFRNSVKNRLLNQFIFSIGPSLISIMFTMFYSFNKAPKIKLLRKKANVEIRLPKRVEYCQVKNLMVNGYRNRLLYESLFKKTHVKNLYREWINNDLKGRVKEVLVAIVDTRVAGFIAFDELHMGNKKYGFIDMIVVEKSVRKKGVGAALISKMMEHLSIDIEGIFLNVELDNLQAINFYMGLGFRIVDSIYTYHVKPNRIAI